MSEQLELFRPHEYGKIDFNPELLHTKRLLEVLEKYLPTREDSYNLNKENKGKLLKNGKLKIFLSLCEKVFIEQFYDGNRHPDSLGDMIADCLKMQDISDVNYLQEFGYNKPRSYNNCVDTFVKFLKSMHVSLRMKSTEDFDLSNL